MYNSRWNPSTIEYVNQGLHVVGATSHIALFSQSAEILNKMPAESVQEFFDSEYFGENPERDILNTFNDKFFRLCKKENLTALNSRWLRSLPDIKILSIAEMEAQITKFTSLLPDKKQRALAAEPRYMKLIRHLCAVAKMELSHVTAGDPDHEFNGKRTLAWHFITNKGHHYFVEAEGQVYLFNDESPESILEVAAGFKFG